MRVQDLEGAAAFQAATQTQLTSRLEVAAAVTEEAGAKVASLEAELSQVRRASKKVT